MRLHAPTYEGGTFDPVNIVLLQQVSVNNAASVVFNFTPHFFLYKLEWHSLRPATDDQSSFLRFSTDGGATFDSSGSYGWSSASQGAEFGRINNGARGVTFMLLGSDTADRGISNVATEAGGSGEVWFFDPLNGDHRSLLMYTTWYGISTVSGSTSHFRGAGGYPVLNAATDAVSVQMESGNIATGSFSLWGVET